jgi:4-hydroxy-3-polyprenylbenzoate decarboxylase
MPEKSNRPIQTKRKRIIVGISGASGVIYGIRLLEVLKQAGIEVHLVMTPAAKITIAAETEYSADAVEKMASTVHRFNDISATLASGSYKTEGMVVVPCSMHTLGALAAGYADNLLVRAAEVTLKERRPLIVVPRETPLTLIHIENMERIAQAGAIVLPAMPAFYERPKTIEELVDHLVGKILDLLGIENELFNRWSGLKPKSI